jgi:CHASE2 domain-containing sensor protein/class 3 adenylate cyclase
VPGYEIVRELGRGGMGVVYLAREVALDRTVALKMILDAGPAGSPERERLRREAQSVASLQHPNIVQVHAVGEQDGRPYLALEYCGGGSLKDRLAGKPLAAREAARLVETIARAVAAAHHKHILHRDLKPGNVLLTEAGDVKVADFGLAKQIDGAPRAPGPGLTRSGAILGTPSYMPPEQARGERVGPAADVYALGAILYECLTGRPPFEAANPVDTLAQVLFQEPVPPRRVRPDMPAALELICLQCLQKDSGKRYAAAEALAEALRRFLDGVPAAEDLAPERGSRLPAALRAAVTKLRRPALRGIWLGLGCALVCWALGQSPWLRGLEEWAHDGFFALRGTRPSRARIMIIGLDDAALDQLRRPLAYTSPELAEVVAYLKAQKAAAVGIDLLVPEGLTGEAELQPGKRGDASKLGQAVHDAGNVVLAEWHLEGRWQRPVWQWQFKYLNDPGPFDFGFVNLTDDDDYFLRRQQLMVRDGDSAHYDFALALFAVARHAEVAWTDGELRAAGEVVPLDDEQKVRVNFLGPPGTVPVISFRDVLAAARKTGPAGPDWAGAVVIIGVTARSQQDYHMTPFANNFARLSGQARSPLMAGAEVHANILATLDDRAYLRTPPALAILAFLLVAGGALGWTFARLNLLGGFAVAVLFVAGWQVVAFAAFSAAHWRLPVVSVALLGIIVYAAAGQARWRLMRRLLGRVKSEAVARLLEADPEGQLLRGEDRVVTVLCARLRGFSAYCAKHSAHEVVALLNAYYTAVVPLLEEQGGTLNQYLGDHLVVYFGAPEVQGDHALRAVRAAVGMVRQVRALGPTWAELDAPDLRLDVGVSTGRVVAGAVGSPQRLDYAVTGAPVQAAAGTAALNEKLATDILIGAETYHDLPGKERRALGCEERGRPVPVEGHEQPLVLHAVVVADVTVLHPPR